MAEWDGGCVTMAKGTSLSFQFDALVECGGSPQQITGYALGGNLSCMFKTSGAGTDAGFTPNSAVISVLPTTLSFNAEAGGTMPFSQSLVVKNVAATPTTLNWAYSISPPSGWLQVTPGPGSGLNSNDTSNQTVEILTAYLSSGTRTADITVFDVNGCAADPSRACTVSYAIRPVVTLLPLQQGCPSGGEYVEIDGRGFNGTTSVTFGGNTAMGFTVNSDTRITAQTPPGSGTVHVVVTSGGQSSAATSNDEFTYVCP